MARSWSEGHWPILSPYSWVCGNLAGEFQYGTFSVFVNALVVLIWKFPLAFPQQAAALSIAHLFVSRDWRIFARTRSRVFSRLIHLCRADCLVKRLDHLLGGDRLVRCARRIHLVAMGVVGSGTRSGFAANKMAVPLARALRLSARHGGISLHGFNAAAPHCVVGRSKQCGWPRRRNIRFLHICSVADARLVSRSVSGFPHPHGWRFLTWFRVRHANCSPPQHIGNGAFRLRRCRD